ncbi:MAG: GGDEF domain-containing protein [Candidatus Limivivens sp.]|nr:GGDEF domain-containing protein [Candidatus Limivivens sp.]
MDKDNHFIQTIKKEHQKVDEQWLRFHTRITIVLGVTSSLFELVMFFVLHAMGLISSSVPVYLVKYLMIPTGLNLLLVLLICFINRSRSGNRTMRIYTVSLSLVAICFVLFTIHSVFPSLYLLFAIPMMLTCLYGDYRLTTLTSTVSIAARIAGELLITWDPDTEKAMDGSYGTINILISVLILIAFYLACLTLIYFERQKNRAGISKELERYYLQEELFRDSLTSLSNRAALEEALADLPDSEDDTNCIFAMLDIDYFKQVNDTLGHLAGDAYLKDFALLLKEICTPHTVYRYAGDEFSVIFRGISMKEALLLCQKVRQESSKILKDCPFPYSIAASYGLSAYQKGSSPKSLVEDADSSLYLFKKSIRVPER